MKLPKLSISTAFDYSIPIEDQVTLVAEAGFSHISLGANAAHSGYLTGEGRTRLRTLLRQHGLAVDTIHGPQAGLHDSVSQLTATAVAAAELGARVVVMHAGPFEFEADALPRHLEAALATCRQLEPIVHATGIVFSLENVMPGPATDLVQQALTQLDPECFGLCYDSAHEQIGGPRSMALLADLSERVAAVHLSDRIGEHVDHLIPGEGFIDWTALIKLLRSTSFAGPLLFEVMVEHSSQKAAKPFLKLAYERACHVYSLWAEAG